MTVAAIDRKQLLNQAFKTLVTITGMVLLPIMVHLVPFSGDAPLGAYLLPMFIAPLVAAFFVSPVGLILATVIAPLLNHLLTGMPSGIGLTSLIGELIVFSLIASWAIRQRIRFTGFSAVAFLAAKLIVLIPRLILLGGGLYLTDIGNNLMDLSISLPGLLILLALERFLARMRNL